jgi:hypothetical protein
LIKKVKRIKLKMDVKNPLEWVKEIMEDEHITYNQIRQLGLAILNRELGAVGLIRFLQQYEKGEKDYTKERQRWLEGKDVDTIVKQIKQKKESQ